MLYILLALISLFFSVLASKSSSKEHYNKYLCISLIFLFVIWGFEYYNTVDYSVMLNKFNQVIYNIKEYTNTGDIVYIEPGCKLLFYLCSPFGNLSYYVLVAFFEILILRYIIVKYIPNKFLWVLVMLILFQFEYVTVIMTLKRQMLAIFVSLLVICLLNEKEYKWNNKKLYISSLLLVILAFSFHKSVLISILFIPIWIIAKYRISKILIILLIGIYFVQYTFNLGNYASLFFDLIQSQDDKYAHYALQIEDGGRQTSHTHILIEFILYFMTLMVVNSCNKKERVFLISGMIYYILVNFFIMDSGRILLPFYMCQLISIPIILSKIVNYKLRLSLMLMFAVISIKSTYQVYTNIEKSSMTEGFKSFNLIFEAPSFQIDNPNAEKRKYLPYR